MTSPVGSCIQMVTFLDLFKSSVVKKETCWHHWYPLITSIVLLYCGVKCTAVGRNRFEMVVDNYTTDRVWSCSRRMWRLMLGPPRSPPPSGCADRTRTKLTHQYHEALKQNWSSNDKLVLILWLAIRREMNGNLYIWPGHFVFMVKWQFYTFFLILFHLEIFVLLLRIFSHFAVIGIDTDTLSPPCS